MSKALIPALFVFVAGLFIGLGDDVLKDADQAYKDHNYKSALRGYRAAAALPVHKHEGDRIRRRIGLCHAKLREFGKARVALGDAVTQATTARQKARALVERGVLASTMPGYYYEKKGTKTWGRWVQGATYHHIGHDLLQDAVVDLQAARIIYQGAVDQAIAQKASRAAFAREHFRCNLELAAAIENLRNQLGDKVKGRPAKAGDDAYGKLTAWNDRMVHVFDRAMIVQESCQNAQARVMAGYLKAMAFRRLLESYRKVVVGEDGVLRCQVHRQPDSFSLPEAWNPIKILDALRPIARKSSLGDEVLFALARVQRHVGLYVDSVANSKKLLDQFPKSRLRPDASQAIEQMTFARLRLEVGKNVADGAEPEANLHVRNIKNVKIRVFKFPIEDVLGDPRILKNGKLTISNANDLVKAMRGSPHGGGEVASMQHRTGDEGKHIARSEPIRLPVSREGCYLVEATAGDLVYRDLLVISDLALLRQVDGDRTLVFAVDAKTGAPQPKVEVLVRHRYQVRGLVGWRWDSKVERGTTNADGVFEVAHPAVANQRGRYLSVYGHTANRNAMIASTWYRARGNASNARELAYVFTDRPVYRPGHAVNFAAMLRRSIDGKYENLKDEYVTVQIRDPKGTVIFDEAMETDGTGALDARITLGEEPPLGRYRINLKHRRRRLSAGYFRVEEYKKPEFQVTVQGPKQQVRLGGSVSATLKADYFFGAPVVGAKVSWRVFRERFRPSFRRNEPYRALYGSIPRNVDPSDRGRGRELVVQGESALDAKGQIVIEWPTKKYEAYENEDSLFVVQADVTDSSRRTISGSNRIPVTRTSFVTQLSSQRGFWAQGETGTYEIQTQTPSGAPVATRGKARVYRVTQEMRGGKPHDILTQILEEDASTNDLGIGFVRWTADDAGRFVISYQAKDAWGEFVRGDIPVWVSGPSFTASGFQMKNLEIITDKRVYEPGETALLMVNSNYQDSAVLICMVAGDRTLNSRVVRLKGKTTVMRLPITNAFTPNVHLTAMTVRDGKSFNVTHEILVPPTEKLLDVSMAFSKPEYRPGEKGEVTVSVKDKDGKPVAARVAMTCLDSSIFYIQEDQTPDIRRFFYGSRRSQNVRTGTSVNFAFSGYLARTVEWGKYEVSGWLPAWRNQTGRVSRILELKSFGKDEMFEGVVKDELVADSEKADADGEANRWGERAGQGRGGGGRGRRSRGFAGAPAAGGDGSARAPTGAPAEERKAKSRKGRPGNSLDKMSEDLSEATGETAEAGPELRTDFRDTAVWAPDVICGADGKGKVTVPFPQSLTTWRAKAIAWTDDTRVGTGSKDVTTTKDILVRLQAPRFFIEGDRIVVSALVNNRTAKPVTGRALIGAEGGTLRLVGDAEREITIPARGETRLDWWCDVIGHGAARITVKALTATDSDAMRMDFPVTAWGAQKTVTQTSVLNGGGQASIALQVPARRRVDASELVVTLQPSLALTLLDALPYLIQYPYGCTEQTMSRFIPAVACARTLKEAGVTLAQIAEARRNLPKAAQQGRGIAVVSDRVLADVVRTGLNRITGMQNSDGGWGWWKRDRSSPYLTAYVISGLLIAKEAGYSFNPRILSRGVKYLEAKAKNIDNLHTGAYVAWALAGAKAADEDLLARVFKSRDDLGIYGKALLASALKRGGQASNADLVVQNLADFVKQDAENGTAHWDPVGSRWRWWNSRIEANAAVLQALMDVKPDHAWGPALVKWLVRNRQGNRWTNTRDTANCILALSRYARAAGELAPDYTVDVSCGGQKRTYKVDRKSMFAFDNRFVIKGDALTSGEMPLEINIRGTGRVYVTASLSYFTQEDKITGAGHELFVRRSYHKVIEKPVSSVVNGKTVRKLVDQFTPIAQGADVTAGDIIEVRLEVEAKNDYSYLLFEDMKPAGFEPLQLRSGRSYERGICSNVEFRDERTAFFVSWLEQGTHTLSYRVRAEAPGTLRALPARGEAMYAPSFRGISDSFKIKVKDMQRL